MPREGGFVSHHFGGALTSLKKYRAIWGMAMIVIVSQYRAIWGNLSYPGVMLPWEASTHCKQACPTCSPSFLSLSSFCFSSVSCSSDDTCCKQRKKETQRECSQWSCESTHPLEPPKARNIQSSSKVTKKSLSASPAKRP